MSGISSVASVAAALKLQEKKDFANKNIVVILPSACERHLIPCYLPICLLRLNYNNVDCSRFGEKKAPVRVIFCGLDQTVNPSRIDFVDHVLYLSGHLFRSMKLIRIFIIQSTESSPAYGFPTKIGITQLMSKTFMSQTA